MWKVKFSAVVLLLLFFVLEAEPLGRGSRRSRSKPPCRPRACQVSSWSEWGPCSHQCGASGKMKRIRKITVVATCGGSCPFKRFSQIRSCNRVKCQNSGTPTGRSLSCVSCIKKLFKYRKQINLLQETMSSFSLVCLDWRTSLICYDLPIKKPSVAAFKLEETRK